MEAAIKEDAVGALDMLMTKLNELDPQERTKAISQMFWKDNGSVLIAKLADDIEMYKETMAMATDETARAGSMQGEFSARSATTANQLQILKNNVTEMGINIGATMLPAINSIATSLSPLITGMAQFAAANPGITQMAVAFLLVVAAIGPVIVAIGSVVAAIGVLIPVFAAVGAGIAAAWAVIQTAFIVGALVIGAIATSVAAPFLLLAAVVAAAAVGIVANWASVRASLSSLSADISARFQAMGASISATWSRVVAGARAAGQGIASGFRSAVAGVSSAMSSIRSTVMSVLSGLAGQAMAAGARVVQGIARGIMSGIGAIGAAMSSVTSAIASKLPGSPVKEGVLTVLNHGYAGKQIVEMIAGGMEQRQGLIGGATNNAVSPVAMAASATSSGSSGVSNFSPNVTINISGSGDPQAVGAEVKRQVAELFAQFQQQQSRQNWLSYS
jgi:hypothetical protein